MAGVNRNAQLILANKNAACYGATSQPERGEGTMADDAVMEVLVRIQASIVTLDQKIATLDQKIATLDQKIVGLDEKFTTQYTILAQDVRMIRGGIHDMVRTRVTAGEMDSLHEDVNRMQQGLAALTMRVDILEHTKP
jgi:hypothetical protein